MIGEKNKLKIRIVSYRNIYGKLCYNYYQDAQYIGYYGGTGKVCGLWNTNEKDYTYIPQP